MLTLDRLLGMAAVAGGTALATYAIKNGAPMIKRAQDKHAVKKILNTDDFAKYAIKRISEECSSGRLTLDGVMDLVEVMDAQRAQLGLESGDPLAAAMEERERQEADTPIPQGGVRINGGQQFKDFSHDAAEVSGIPENFGGPGIVFESAEAAKAGKRAPRPEHFKVIPEDDGISAELRRFFPLA